MENNNLEIIRKIVEEGFGKEDLSVIDHYVSDAVVEHQSGLGDGKEGLKNAINGLHTSFPDLNYDLQNHAENGDTVWVHYKASATHTGPFMGVPSSGKRFTIDVIDVARFENNRLVEHWGIPDRFSLLMQLGLLDKK